MKRQPGPAMIVPEKVIGRTVSSGIRNTLPLPTPSSIPPKRPGFAVAW